MMKILSFVLFLLTPQRGKKNVEVKGQLLYQKYKNDENTSYVLLWFRHSDQLLLRSNEVIGLEFVKDVRGGGAGIEVLMHANEESL